MVEPCCLKAIEQFQAADARHPDIGDEAVEPTGGIGCQKGLGPVEDVTGITHGQKKIGEGITDIFVVVYERNDRRIEHKCGLLLMRPVRPTS